MITLKEINEEYFNEFNQKIEDFDGCNGCREILLNQIVIFWNSKIKEILEEVKPEKLNKYATTSMINPTAYYNANKLEENIKQVLGEE